jgi:hypothetical protein
LRPRRFDCTRIQGAKSKQQFFDDLGVRVQLIKTEEDGTVEENAAIIAPAIRALRDNNVILVSMSKGRPEVVLANERRTLHFATVQTFQDRKAELIE